MELVLTQPDGDGEPLLSAMQALGSGTGESVQGSTQALTYDSQPGRYSDLLS